MHTYLIFFSNVTPAMELWNQRVLDWNHVTRHMEGSYGRNGTVLRMYLTSDTIRLYHHLPSNPSVCTVRPLSFGLCWAIQMAYVGWFGFMHRNILFCICILEFTHMLSCLLAFEFRLPPRRRFSFFGIWHNLSEIPSHMMRAKMHKRQAPNGTQ